MKRTEKTIIIIGAGISGMAAGCYAQMNDFKTRIFEMHTIPGGNCTAWRRKEYIFDPTIEWLWGSGPHTLSNQIWRELGALRGKKITNFDVFNQVTNADGKTVHFYLDPDKLESHLKEISSIDKEPIEEFCNGLRTFAKVDFDLPLLIPLKLMGIWQKLKFIYSLWPYFKAFGHAEETQLSDFTSRFKDPFLREAFRYIFFQDHVIFPLFPYYTNLAAAIKKNAGFPEGGSLGLSKSIAKRYKELGGEIFYDKRIKKIIVKNNQAVGIQLEDGSCDFADIIISACDGRTVIFDMLEGKYTNKTIETLYARYLKEPYIYNGVTQVFLGVNRDFKNEPHSVTYMLTNAEAKELPSLKDKSIVIQFRTNYSPEFAPPGKSVIFAIYLTDYDYWKNLYQDREAYKEQKQKTADFVIKYLDRLNPGLKEQVEVVDVSTPVTVQRYTGNYKGSIMAWKPFTKAEKLGEKFINKGMKLPGLKNFYMTGQWTLVGGLIRASSLGRYVIQFVCRDNGKQFRTTM